MVLEPARDRDDPRPLVLTEDRWAGRISSADYSGASAPVGSMPLPKRVEHRQPRVRRDLASALLSAAAGLSVPGGRRRGAADEEDAFHDPELTSLRAELRRHPSHEAPAWSSKIREAERYLRLERENAQLEKKVAAATNSLARTFDRIVGLLTEREFIEDSAADPKVTDDGRLLARIYSESDLLVAECLRTGAWAGLNPAELAAVVSAVLYETRGGDGPSAPFAAEAPTPAATAGAAADGEAVRRVARRRATAPIAPSREPDDGFVSSHLPLGPDR